MVDSIAPSFRNLDVVTQQEIAAADLLALKSTAPGTGQHVDIAQQIAVYASRYDAYATMTAPVLHQVREILLANRVQEHGFVSLLDGVRAPSLRYQEKTTQYSERAERGGSRREIGVVAEYALRLLNGQGGVLRSTEDAPAHSLRVLIGWDNAVAIAARVGIDQASKRSGETSYVGNTLSKSTTFIGELVGQQLFTGLVPSHALINHALSEHIQTAKSDPNSQRLLTPTLPGALRFALEKASEMLGPDARVAAPMSDRSYMGVLLYLNHNIALQTSSPSRVVVHDVPRLAADPTQFRQLVQALENGSLLNLQYGRANEPAKMVVVGQDSPAHDARNVGRGAEMA